MNQAQHLLEIVNQHINQISLLSEPKELYAPITYTLGNGGKRIRPVMTLMGCELFGGNYQQALNPAIGLEIFHNFTLLHDDIMDNAPIRRGKPTVHEKWDANTAILSGDAMYAIAFDFMLKTPDDCLRDVLTLFNKTVIEVCEGQQYDMNFETRRDVSEAEYLEMIRLKTAVLPAACLETGAIIASATKEQAALLNAFGSAVGMAFQLRDDYLDVFGDEKVFGKKTGGDILANKKTWLLIKAFELASSAQRDKLNSLINQTSIEPQTKIDEVTAIFRELQLDKRITDKMQDYYQQALTAMEKIQQPQEAKNPLIDLANLLLKRDS